VAAGDVVLVEALQPGSAGASSPARTFGLRQLPAVDGALVALDPHTGRVLAMAGGYAYGRSEFNRATQALRQPGSAFKPFVYLAALEADMTPSSMVLDAPFTASQGPGLPNWTPSNYSNDFLGLATLRVGIEQSRNLMTVRLADQIGMDRVVTTAEQFGIYDRMPPYLAFALGAGETTVLRLTAAYAMLVNGGKKITPTLIDRVQDRHGRTVFRHDQRPCPGCRGIGWVRGEGMPEIPDTREAVTDPTSAYQMVTMLQGVVERGTGKRVKEVGKPLAGKTGTSNEARDTWFVGFSPDLAVGVFVGFDEPTPLGPGETGGLAASPIFRDFMAEALKDEAAVPFRVPPGVRLVRVNATSGLPTGVGDKRAVLEPFKPGTEPGAEGRKLGNPDTASGGPATGTGGLY
jgi:penicillin-binding protein 1A